MERPQRPSYEVVGNVARATCDVGRLWLKRDIDALDRVVRTGDLLSANHAIEALDEIRDPASVKTYLWCLEVEEDVLLLDAAAQAVGHAGERRAVPRLLALLNQQHPSFEHRPEKPAAATALGELKDPAAIPTLLAKVTSYSVGEAARWGHSPTSAVLKRPTAYYRCCTISTRSPDSRWLYAPSAR